MTVITISREMGSLGDEIAVMLANRFGMELIVREKIITEWLGEVATAFEQRMLSESPKFYMNSSKEGPTYKDIIEKRLIDFTREQPAVIVGMGAHTFLSGDVVNLRFIASVPVRLQRIQKKYGIPEAEAQMILSQADKRYKRFIATVFDTDWNSPGQYDLVVNTDQLRAEECMALVVCYMQQRESSKVAQDAPNDSVVKKALLFKHPAEAEFAKILDAYHIDWEYEPRTFPVEWDENGNVLMAFSPDFYLTKFDTYIEITTMNQKYVTIKNKKVRRLRELYPDINIKIVYKKDFHSLLKRFKAAVNNG